ncbi:MAG TPA: ABC transporter permease [Terriglobia bacterium]|nr:ABC transporter permease [Terriglobia bacterium]
MKNKLAELSRRLVALFYHRQLDVDLEEEMRLHQELREQEQVERGVSLEEAHYAAQRRFGNKLVLREESRDMWGWNWLETFLRDVRYGLRTLAKSPGFTVVAVITLALGIGANAAIFQLVDAVRLRTLPVKDPQSLAIIHLKTDLWMQGNFNGPYPQFTYPLWQQVRQRQQAFSSIAVWSSDKTNLANGGEMDIAHDIWASGDFFTVLGVHPFLGRLISPSDDQPGCAGGVDLSYAFWQRRYGGDASAIGKTLTLDGHPFPIVGVTPPGFYGVSVGNRFDLAVPICAEPIVYGEYSRITSRDARHDWWLAMIGRLNPGWSLARAKAQLAAIAPAALHETIPPQYDADHVKHYLTYKLEALPAANGFSDLRQRSSTSLWLLLGLSGLVLLIACANLANLMLARASTRGREIALRVALGASCGRLIRQLLSESALLAVAGAVCGGVLAAILSRSLVAFISTPNNPVFLDMPTDWRVLGFVAGLAILTTILFGLAPALRSGSVPPSSILKTAGRGMTSGREHFRLQRVLVVAQVALSLVLLAGALLFARSLENLMTRPLGFQQNGVLVANINFPRLNLPEARRNPFVSELLDRVRAVPGVAAAAASNRSPVNGNSSNDGILAGNSTAGGQSWQEQVSPGYFQTMEIPFLAGRDFNGNDSAKSPMVAIVNQVFVKKFLSGSKNAVGQQFRLDAPQGMPKPYCRVVGVVENSVYNDMHEPFVPVMYFPRAQDDHPGVGVTFLLRSQVSTASLANSVKNAIAGVNPEVDIQFVVLRTQIRGSLVQDELMATLCGFFGGLAVLLAAIGLYGVISYTVAQRTNEIGIRMALGAQRSGIVTLILGEVAVLIGIGIAIGAGLALGGGRAASSLLYGLKANDPLTLALAVILLAAIGLAASFVPARRASHLDPVVALRYE